MAREGFTELVSRVCSGDVGAIFGIEITRLARSPAGAWADDHGIPVLTPDRPRDPEFLARLADLAPDCVPMVAYGALAPPAALAIPRHGWVNLHFSLLPAWRGAAPVQHAVLHGDELTGACVQRVEAALDTGPVYKTLTEQVRATDTAGDLLCRLSVSGARLLVDVLDGIASGVLAPVPQPAEGVSMAPKITVEDVAVRWDEPALAVDRRIRAGTPTPGGWSVFRGERVKLGPVRPVPHGPALTPGVISVRRSDVLVGTGTHPVRLGEVWAAGKKPMPADAWARGVRPAAGEAFEVRPA